MCDYYKSMSKAKAREEYKKKMRESEPVFRLRFINNNSAKCRYLGTIENREKLSDEPMKLEDDILDLVSREMGKYSISVRALSCNIPGTFMLKHKKYPLFYMTFNYTNQLVGGVLFNLYLYINLSKECADSLKLPKNYVDKIMTGNYTIELVPDEGFLTFAVNKIRPKYEMQVQTKYAEIFETLTDEEKDKLDQTINIETEQLLDKLRNKFEPIQLIDQTNPENSYITKSKIIKHMVKVINDEMFDTLVQLCLEFREYERQQKMGFDRPIKLPKKVIKLEDFKDNPEAIEEYVNNLNSDSESDNSDLEED